MYMNITHLLKQHHDSFFYVTGFMSNKIPIFFLKNS